MLRNLREYRRPETIDDAVALVQSNPNAQYLAGGAWIVAKGDPTLEMVVDLQALGLRFIESALEEIRIGALARLQEIVEHPDIQAMAGGLLAHATSYVQSRNLREQGSIGGTLITAGPADPLTTALLVLDTEILYADPVNHRAPFMSFVAYRDRLVETRALITELRIRRPPLRSGAAFKVVGRSPKDKPIVCAASYIEMSEGLPETVRLAIGGADSHPVRLHKTEHLLQGQLFDQDRITAALKVALVELSPPADFRGSAEYRLAMAEVLGRRAIMSAWETARRVS